jgi:hypothetical protein
MWAANLATGFQIRFALRNGQEESAEVHYFNGGEPNLIAIRVSSNLLSQVSLAVGRISLPADVKLCPQWHGLRV